MFVCRTARVREAVQARGPVDPTGRVQMAEEALSQSAPDLQRLLQTTRHHRYRFAARHRRLSSCVLQWNFRIFPKNGAAAFTTRHNVFTVAVSL